MLRAHDSSKASSTLIDQFLPKGQFRESHEGVMAVSPKRILDAIGVLSDSDEPLIRGMMKMRGAPPRIAGAYGLPSTERSPIIKCSVKSQTRERREHQPLRRVANRSSDF